MPLKRFRWSAFAFVPQVGTQPCLGDGAARVGVDPLGNPRGDGATTTEDVTDHARADLQAAGGFCPATDAADV